jgi:3-oxoacyl-[acyl-carrier-protein] synthase-3
MRPARIAALRYDLPGSGVGDDELASELSLAAGEVARWSRSLHRHEAADGEGPADMASRAAVAALAELGREPGDVDFFVFATNTPDHWFPGSACVLQALLDAPTVACLDVRSQCAGFVVALDLARRFIATGTNARVLVAAAEVPSHHNRRDGEQPALACGMSDAAAVAVVEPGEGRGEILAVQCRTDGSAHRSYWCEAPASRNLEDSGVRRGQRLTRRMIEDGRIYPRADLVALRETALREVPGILQRALEEASLDSVDALLVAHLDCETREGLERSIADRAGRVLSSDVLYSMAAALPLGLARAVERGEVETGESVALVTAGAGASWGAAIIRV